MLTDMIRPVLVSDAQAIADIYSYFVMHTTVSFETEAPDAEEMEHRIRSISASCPYLVAEEDGKVVGYCYVHPWKERAAYSHTYETTIYLSPTVCHKGIGTQLMQRLIEECRTRGFHSLIACITAENRASILMHKKLGFHQVSDFKEVGRKFGRWLDVVDMEFIL